MIKIVGWLVLVLLDVLGLIELVFFVKTNGIRMLSLQLLYFEFRLHFVTVLASHFLSHHFLLLHTIARGQLGRSFQIVNVY